MDLISAEREFNHTSHNSEVQIKKFNIDHRLRSLVFTINCHSMKVARVT